MIGAPFVEHYLVMGLSLSSCVRLPLQPSGISHADAQILVGSVADPGLNTDELKKAAVCRKHESIGSFYELTMSSQEKLFIIGNCGRVSIKDGNKVLLDLEGKALQPEFLIPFLMSAALPTLFQQRGLFALHASCLQINGKVVAFAGHSGMGKSTTVATLLTLGGQLVADDVLMVHFDTERGAVMVYPEYQWIRMNPQSLHALQNEEWVSENNRITWDNHKWLVTPPHAVKSTLRLDLIYFLDWTTDENLQIRSLSEFEAFQEMHQTTYRLYEPSEELRARHFEWAGRLASRVPAKIVARPRNLDYLYTFANTILEDLSGPVPNENYS